MITDTWAMRGWGQKDENKTKLEFEPKIQSAIPNFMYLLVCPPVTPKGNGTSDPSVTGVYPLLYCGWGIHQLNHQV